MSNAFFDHPILNSPYECPLRHWELDAQGQPTQKIVEVRRKAEFITPIPKPKKRGSPAQQQLVFDEFTDVYEIESDFAVKVEARFNAMIGQVLQS